MAIMKKKYIKPMVTSVCAAEEAIMVVASLYNINKIDSEETIAGEQTPIIDWPPKQEGGIIWND
jgi:translation elongation factor EF-Tu-like GTPase